MVIRAYMIKNFLKLNSKADLLMSVFYTDIGAVRYTGRLGYMMNALVSVNDIVIQGIFYAV